MYQVYLYSYTSTDFSFCRLHELEEQELESFGSVSRKIDFALSRHFIREVCSEKLDLDLYSEPLLKEGLGRPYFKSLRDKGYEVSVSHTKGFVAFVVSQSKVLGLDIELLREIPEKTMRRICSEEDLSLSKNYVKTWTRKEALGKAFGEGMQLGLKNFSVFKDEVFCKGEKVFLHTEAFKGLCISLASSDEALFEIVYKPLSSDKET